MHREMHICRHFIILFRCYYYYQYSTTRILPHICVFIQGKKNMIQARRVSLNLLNICKLTIYFNNINFLKMKIPFFLILIIIVTFIVIVYILDNEFGSHPPLVQQQKQHHIIILLFFSSYNDASGWWKVRFYYNIIIIFW